MHPHSEHAKSDPSEEGGNQVQKGICVRIFKNSSSPLPSCLIAWKQIVAFNTIVKEDGKQIQLQSFSISDKVEGKPQGTIRLPPKGIFPLNMMLTITFSVLEMWHSVTVHFLVWQNIYQIGHLLCTSSPQFGQIRYYNVTVWKHLNTHPLRNNNFVERSPNCEQLFVFIVLSLSLPPPF